MGKRADVSQQAVRSLILLTQGHSSKLPRSHLKEARFCLLDENLFT